MQTQLPHPIMRHPSQTQQSRQWPVVSACVLALLFLSGLITHTARADGDESLGAPSIPIAPGSGLVAAGTGLEGQPSEIQINIPADVTILQVLLYWAGRTSDASPPQGSTIEVGEDNTLGTTVAGLRIGKSGAAAPMHTYRADITNLALNDFGFAPGSNSLWVGELDFAFHNNGAGLLVIFDDGTDGTIDIRDGSDASFIDWPAPSKETQIVTFSFAPVDHERDVDIWLFVADAQNNPNRPERVYVWIGDVLTTFENTLQAVDGRHWDTWHETFTVPAHVDEISIRVLSEETGLFGQPESLNWLMAGIGLEGEEIDPGALCEGQVTELRLRNLGDPEEIEVRQKVRGNVVFGPGFVSTGETFLVAGGNHSAHNTLGPEIDIFVDGTFTTRIHTSCSQPIYRGLVVGDFEVVDGFSRVGGRLPTEEEFFAQSNYVGESAITNRALVDEETPHAFALHGAYPNPFNPQTTIGFSLPEATSIRLVVYDALGREVTVLAAGDFEAGHHTAIFDAGNLPSGMYLYRLYSTHDVRAGTMVLMK